MIQVLVLTILDKENKNFSELGLLTVSYCSEVLLFWWCKFVARIFIACQEYVTAFDAIVKVFLFLFRLMKQLNPLTVTAPRHLTCSR